MVEFVKMSQTLFQPHTVSHSISSFSRSLSHFCPAIFHLLPVMFRIKDVIFSITASLNKLISPSQPLSHFGCQYNTFTSLQYSVWLTPGPVPQMFLGCISLWSQLMYLSFFYFYPSLLSVKSVAWKGAAVGCL
jgi:hypothetical protein